MYGGSKRRHHDRKNPGTSGKAGTETNYFCRRLRRTEIKGICGIPAYQHSIRVYRQ